MDAADLLHKLTRSFTEDIAQEAITRALEHGADEGYAWTIARHLALWHYHDGLAPHKRTKESVTPSQPDDVIWWASPLAIDPYRIVSARKQLRDIPDFILEWHLTNGFVWRQRCGHPWSQRYPVHFWVRCRGCDREDSANAVRRRHQERS